jgi:outer membrane biogenesis lipoprotein LolB
MRVVLAVVACALLAGCSLNMQFVNAVDGYTGVLLPEYKIYISKDSTLNDDTKRIRTQTADKFQELVNEAKKNGGK